MLAGETLPQRLRGTAVALRMVNLCVFLVFVAFVLLQVFGAME